MGGRQLAQCYAYFFAAGCWTRFVGPSFSTMSAAKQVPSRPTASTPIPYPTPTLALTPTTSPDPDSDPDPSPSPDPTPHAKQRAEGRLLAGHTRLHEYAEEVTMLRGGTAEGEQVCPAGLEPQTSRQGPSLPRRARTPG